MHLITNAIAGKMKWTRYIVVLAGLGYAGCSDEPTTAPLPEFAKLEVRHRYETGGMTMDVRTSKGATTVVAMTDVGDGPRIVFIQRTLPNEAGTFLTYVSDGRMITSKRLPDGSTVPVNKHDRASGGTCGTRWLDGERFDPAVAVSVDCEIPGEVTPYMTCMPTPEYDCGGGGGGGGGECCTSEAEKKNSALQDYFWATGAVTVACWVPQPLEPIACGVATAYALAKLYAYNSAKLAYDYCRQQAKYDPSCTSIALNIPWDKKGIPTWNAYSSISPLMG